jgi:hypothetical protein
MTPVLQQAVSIQCTVVDKGKDRDLSILRGENQGHQSVENLGGSGTRGLEMVVTSGVQG